MCSFIVAVLRSTEGVRAGGDGAPFWASTEKATVLAVGFRWAYAAMAGCRVVSDGGCRETRMMNAQSAPRAPRRKYRVRKTTAILGEIWELGCFAAPVVELWQPSRSGRG